jgi:hypothetical protein
VDQRVRAAERQWRSSSSDPNALEVLRLECARAGNDLPDDAVRALPRWQRSLGFARKWRGRPLGARDGLPMARIREREDQLGFRLPAALRQWYSLVGGALREVQDTPVKLDDLSLEGGLVAFFVENQGCFHWAVLEDHLGEDDPPVHGGYELRAPGRVADHLSEVLFAKVLSETTLSETTLAGEVRCSTIGRLRRGVRGGYFEGEGFADDVVADRYPRLPVVSTGFPDESVLHGDADTIVQVEGSGYAWAVARTAEAWAVLEGLGFGPPD